MVTSEGQRGQEVGWGWQEEVLEALGSPEGHWQGGMEKLVMSQREGA